MAKPLPSEVFVCCHHNNCGDPLRVEVVPDKKHEEGVYFKAPSSCKSSGRIDPGEEIEVLALACDALEQYMKEDE